MVAHLLYMANYPAGYAPLLTISSSTNFHHELHGERVAGRSLRRDGRTPAAQQKDIFPSLRTPPRRRSLAIFSFTPPAPLPLPLRSIGRGLPKATQIILATLFLLLALPICEHVIASLALAARRHVRRHRARRIAELGAHAAGALSKCEQRGCRSSTLVAVEDCPHIEFVARWGPWPRQRTNRTVAAMAGFEIIGTRPPACPDGRSRTTTSARCSWTNDESGSTSDLERSASAHYTPEAHGARATSPNRGRTPGHRLGGHPAAGRDRLRGLRHDDRTVATSSRGRGRCSRTRLGLKRAYRRSTSASSAPRALRPADRRRSS